MGSTPTGATMFQQVTEAVDAGKEVALSLGGYVDFTAGDIKEITASYEMIWKAGATPCFRYKKNGTIVHLLPNQKEDMMIMGS